MTKERALELVRELVEFCHTRKCKLVGSAEHGGEIAILDADEPSTGKSKTNTVFNAARGSPRPRWSARVIGPDGVPFHRHELDGPTPGEQQLLEDVRTWLELQQAPRPLAVLTAHFDALLQLTERHGFARAELVRISSTAELAKAPGKLLVRLPRWQDIEGIEPAVVEWQTAGGRLLDVPGRVLERRFDRGTLHYRQF